MGPQAQTQGYVFRNCEEGGVYRLSPTPLLSRKRFRIGVTISSPRSQSGTQPQTLEMLMLGGPAEAATDEPAVHPGERAAAPWTWKCEQALR